MPPQGVSVSKPQLIQSQAPKWAGLLWSQALCSPWFSLCFSKPWVLHESDATCLQRPTCVHHVLCLTLDYTVSVGTVRIPWACSSSKTNWNKNNFILEVLKGLTNSYFLTWWPRNRWARGAGVYLGIRPRCPVSVGPIYQALYHRADVRQEEQRSSKTNSLLQPVRTCTARAMCGLSTLNIASVTKGLNFKI